MSSSLGIRSIGQRLSRASTATSLAARRSLLKAERSNNESTTAAAVRCLVTTRQQLHAQQQQQQQTAVPQRQQPQQQPPRQFHASALVLNDSDDAADDDTSNLSPKEKKKLLKAKAKAAAAEAAEQQEDDAADRKKALQEKLAAKKAAQEAPPAVEEPEAPPAAEETAPPAAEEQQEEAKSQAEPVQQYSTPELTADAAKHKAGLDDPDRPFYQNPLHHNNPEMQKVFREDFDSDEAFEAAIVPTPPLDLGDGNIAAPEYLHALADEIVHLNMLEMNELVNKIADHYGFHEGMLSPDSDGGEEGEDDDDDDAGEAAPKEEAKTVFDIKLVEFDAKAKIKVIKEVRALAGLGLKEAKELVEGAPKVIHKDVKKEEAEEIKAKLEELGATIEIV